MLIICHKHQINASITDCRLLFGLLYDIRQSEYVEIGLHI